METSLRVEALLAQPHHREDAVIARVSGSEVEDGYLLLQGDYQPQSPINPADIKAEAWIVDGTQLQVELASEDDTVPPSPRQVLSFIHAVANNQQGLSPSVAFIPDSDANRSIVQDIGFQSQSGSVPTGVLVSYI